MCALRLPWTRAAGRQQHRTAEALQPGAGMGLRGLMQVEQCVLSNRWQPSTCRHPSPPPPGLLSCLLHATAHPTHPADRRHLGAVLLLHRASRGRLHHRWSACNRLAWCRRLEGDGQAVQQPCLLPSALHLYPCRLPCPTQASCPSICALSAASCAASAPQTPPPRLPRHPSSSARPSPPATRPPTPAPPAPSSSPTWR